MKYLIIVNLLFVLAHCADKLYVNKLFDAQLLTIGNLLRHVHVKYINVGDVIVNKNIKAYNLKLGDVTKIVRKGDATMWTEEDTLDFEAAVGIDKMYLTMDKIYWYGKTYPKVLIVVFSNKLSFSQSTYTTQTECNETLSDISLSNVRGVTLYSRPKTKLNITSQFVEEVVPFVNDQLSSSDFLNYIQKYLDSCSAHVAENVKNFIKTQILLFDSSEEIEPFEYEDDSTSEDDRESLTLKRLYSYFLNFTEEPTVQHV